MTLDALSGGRVLLGVGMSGPQVIEGWRGLPCDSRLGRTPVRRAIPIYLASIGPRNVTLTGEIADGWLPAFYSPEREHVIIDQLDEGLRRAGPHQIDIAVRVLVARGDDLDECRAPDPSYSRALHWRDRRTGDGTSLRPRLPLRLRRGRAGRVA